MKLSQLLESIPPGKAFLRHLFSRLSNTLKKDVSFANAFYHATGGRETYWKYDDVEIVVKDVLLAAENRNENGIADKIISSFLVSVKADGIYTSHGWIPGRGAAQAVESNYGECDVVVSIAFDLTNPKDVQKSKDLTYQATWKNKVTDSDEIKDKIAKLMKPYRFLDTLHDDDLASDAMPNDIKAEIAALQKQLAANEYEMLKSAGERPEYSPTGYRGFWYTSNLASADAEQLVQRVTDKSPESIAREHAIRALHTKFKEDEELKNLLKRQFENFVIKKGNARYI